MAAGADSLTAAVPERVTSDCALTGNGWLNRRLNARTEARRAIIRLVTRGREQAGDHTFKRQEPSNLLYFEGYDRNSRYAPRKRLPDR